MVIRFLSSIFTFVNKFVNEPKPASMKHLWKYIAGALAFALPVASCSDDNTSDFPDKEWGELTAPVLTVSEEEITLDANKADREALKFSWTAASVVTRSSSVEYDLYLNIEGEDLFKGIKREWGGEADLTISFTHEELNDLIITTFGGKSGERFAFRACVYAHTDNYLIEDKTSEEVAFAATAYAAEVVKPASLWMKGGACEYGWDKAIELPQGEIRQTRRQQRLQILHRGEWQLSVLRAKDRRRIRSDPDLRHRQRRGFAVLSLAVRLHERHLHRTRRPQYHAAHADPDGRRHGI